MNIRPWNLVRATAILGCSLVLSVALVPESLALKPTRSYAVTPRDYGIVFQEVVFQSPDSLRLVGWFYPAQDTSGIANNIVGRVVPVPENLRRPPRPYSTQDRSRRPTIIICDGDAGNMGDLILYAYQFFSRGFNVFTFDWRGFGDSAEWPTNLDQLCYAEFLQDYSAAVDCMKARQEVDPKKIGLLGFSTGAYLSFAMLVMRQDIAAFAGRALLTSFDDVLPILHQLDPKREFQAPGDYPLACLPINAAPNIRVPVFLVVGENDPRTPPWMSETIMGQLKGTKELWIVPGAGHGGQEAPEFTNYPEFFDRAAAFFSKQLGRP